MARLAGVITFVALWVGYAWLAKVRGLRDQSLIATTNRYRQMWMMQATRRDPSVLDRVITQNLSQTPAFFSSTSIIIIGGLFALLGTTDKAAELVDEIPFAQPTPLLVFELKILVMVGIFVYAFSGSLGPCVSTPLWRWSSGHGVARRL